MTITRPTRASHVWDTVESVDIELVYDQLIDPREEACPTFKLLWANMKTDMFGPNLTIGQNIITKHYSPTIAKKNMRFTAQDIDNLTRLQCQPAMMAGSAGDNIVDMALMSNDMRAYINHVNVKVGSMHQGYTDMFNAELFSNHNESLAGNRVDITAALSSSPLPPQGTGPNDALTLENVLAHTDRMNSIPMTIRDTVTGHTFENIATTTTSNAFWKPVVTDHTDATITRSDGGVAAGNADNIDVVTAVADAQALVMEDIYEHLDQSDRGANFRKYGACPRKIYMQLRSFISAITRRDIASPLAELGVPASIELEEYNCIFYLEPMMTYLWPETIFFWNPDTLFLIADSRFNPMIQEWEKIPGTTDFVTWMLHIVQLMCVDRTRQSAMHGYTSS